MHHIKSFGTNLVCEYREEHYIVGPCLLSIESFNQELFHFIKLYSSTLL